MKTLCISRTTFWLAVSSALLSYVLATTTPMVPTQTPNSASENSKALSRTSIILISIATIAVVGLLLLMALIGVKRLRSNRRKQGDMNNELDETIMIAEVLDINTEHTAPEDNSELDQPRIQTADAVTDAHNCVEDVDNTLAETKNPSSEDSGTVGADSGVVLDTFKAGDAIEQPSCSEQMDELAAETVLNTTKDTFG